MTKWSSIDRLNNGSAGGDATIESLFFHGFSTGNKTKIHGLLWRPKVERQGSSSIVACVVPFIYLWN